MNKVKFFSREFLNTFQDIEIFINDWLSTKDIELINISCNNYFVIILYKEKNL